MKTIKLTRGYTTIVCDCHYSLVKNEKWQVSIASRNQKRAKNNHGKLMHRIITNAPPGMEVDHIDGNTLNNQCSNLRICTKQQNMYNLGTRADNSSGHKGIIWYKQTNRWQSQITINTKKYHLGYFTKKQDAVDAYHKKAEELFGSYMRKCC